MNEKSYIWLCSFNAALRETISEGLDPEAIINAGSFADEAVKMISTDRFDPVVQGQEAEREPPPPPQTDMVFDQESQMANAAVDAAIRARLAGKKKAQWNSRTSLKYDAAASFLLQTDGSNARVRIVRIAGNEIEKGVFVLTDFPSYLSLYRKISAEFWNGNAASFKWTIYSRGHQQNASDVMTFEASIPRQQEYARFVAQVEERIHSPTAMPFPPPGAVPQQPFPPQPGYPPPPFPPMQVPQGYPVPPFPYPYPFPYPMQIPPAPPPYPPTVDPDPVDGLQEEREESEDEMLRWRPLAEVASILEMSTSGLRNRINRTLKGRKLRDDEQFNLDNKILARKCAGLWEARVLQPWEASR